MKFILNMSFAPHFVVLFDEKNVEIDRLEWEDFRAGSQHVWDFLGRHKIGTETKLSFVGGVAGPGGFSTLRVGGAIINALAFRFRLPVHQVRADVIARALTGGNGFLLNSFGDGVFVPEGEELSRVAVTQLKSDRPLFIDWLPPEKQDQFVPMKIEADVIKTTLQVLQKAESRRVFLPDYEFPAVR